jgi:hypothetical protein
MRGLILSLALTALTALPVAAQSIGGEYTVAGTNLDGSTSSGQATITLTSETTCTIHWQTGTTSSDGICMRNGSAFSAGYVLGDEVGLVVYQVKENGTLDGLWTLPGKEGSGTEVLSPK